MGVPYWSNSSLLFYLFLALVGMLCMNQVKGVSDNHVFRKCPVAILWWTIWVFFAVFRVVKLDIGGSDAIAYIDYFIHCNDISISDPDHIHNASDFLFKWINKTIRSVSSDYHLFFFCVYGYMVFSFIKFLSWFSKKDYSIVPFILVFYLFLRGFSSIRSNLAIATILLGLLSLARGKKYSPYVFFLSSVLIHKMAIVFALSIPFCHFFRDKPVKIKYIILYVGLGSIIAFILRPYFVMLAQIIDLGGAYGSYVEIAIDNDVFSWVNDFGQMLMAFVMLINRNRILKIASGNLTTITLWNICAFDIILVPVNQMTGIYRGYEFFYLARLCMWSLLLYTVFRKQHMTVKIMGSSIFFCIFLAWMVFRISRTYEDTCLMPYLFDFSCFF
jgi:hypothetical protein